MSDNCLSDRIVAVIGGGAAGMTAAITAAEQGAGRVYLIEKNSILGRKLLATGNGRCNLTNINSPYADEALEFFENLGLLTRIEDEGRVYPYSEQASAVQEVLISKLNDLKVDIRCGSDVKNIEKTERGFRVRTEGEYFDADSVILATGGKAGPQYGSTGDGYRFAKEFGHSVIRLMPSLVQMVSDQAFFKSLKGVRTKGRVELVRNGAVLDREDGEIQFTEDGLSGICIFNLSREYLRGDIIRIDLFPEYEAAQLEELLRQRTEKSGNRSMAAFFMGMLNKKLFPVILSELAIDESKNSSSLAPEDFERIALFLKAWEINVTGTKGWKEAQVTAGGVDLEETDRSTMESRLIPGIYFAGELLDVDEKCGGYNLQWAWHSGMLAGKSAAGA